MSTEIRTFIIPDADAEAQSYLSGFLRTVEVQRIDTAYKDGAWRVLVLYQDLKRKEESQQIEAAIGAVTAPQRLFVLAAQGRRHLVVATSCRVIEHLADPLSSPFAAPRFSRDWWSTLLNGQGR